VVSLHSVYRAVLCSQRAPEIVMTVVDDGKRLWLLQEEKQSLIRADPEPDGSKARKLPVT